MDILWGNQSLLLIWLPENLIFLYKNFRTLNEKKRRILNEALPIFTGPFKYACVGKTLVAFDLYYVFSSLEPSYLTKVQDDFKLIPECHELKPKSCFSSAYYSYSHSYYFKHQYHGIYHSFNNGSNLISKR